MLSLCVAVAGCAAVSCCYRRMRFRCTLLSQDALPSRVAVAGCAAVTGALLSRVSRRRGASPAAVGECVVEIER